MQALVVAKLKSVDVEMQILFADLMERADDPALHDGAEAFDGVSMNCSADIFPIRMVDHAVRDARIEFPVALMIIRRKQADVMRDWFMHKSVERGCIGSLNHASDDVSFTLHSAHYDEFSRSARSDEVSASTLSFMFVLGFPTYISFVYFDIANEFLKFDVAQRDADLAAHEPRGLIGTETHVAAYLKGANTLFACQHQMNDAEPLAQGLVGVLKDRSDQDREAIAILRAHAALPVPFLVLKPIDVAVVAARTAHTFGPAILRKIRLAGVFVRELTLEICNRHLMDLQSVLLFFPHGLVSRGVGPVCQG